MSAETATWLNQNTLIGFVAKRGNAWHYRADLQSGEGNHFDGAIPVQQVKRLLDSVTVVETPVTGTYLGPDGVTTFDDPTSKTLWRLETGKRFGTFKNGFNIHNYSTWLVDTLGDILDVSTNELGIGSAGLLRGGALAWVQVEVPDTVTTPEGVEFRPFLSAATALDGSLSSTYQTGAQVIVCDNTLSAALNESNVRRVKIRHSKNSAGRLIEVREALELIHTVGDVFAEQVAELCAIEVTDKAWAAFLDAHVEVPEKAGRGKTLAENKRDELNRLWNNDNRVSDWKGTGWGVVQAVNTYRTHFMLTRGTRTRVERNMEWMVTGEADKQDGDVWQTLKRVLARV